MIEQVNNLSIKSFSNYTGPDEKFKNINIIFGYNGRGKSALAEGIIKEFLKSDNNSIANCRFFNKDYIEKNLTLQETDNPHIKGVIANFGEKNIDVDRQIEEFSNKIVNIGEFEKRIFELEKDIKAEIGKIFSKKKGKLNIKNKQSNLSAEDTIKLYEEDFKKSLKYETEKEKIVSIVGDDTFEVLKEKVEKLPKIESISLDKIDILKEIFLKKYDDLDIPSSEIISWLNIGYELHKSSTKCIFCGNNVNLKELKNKLDVYNSNVKQKDKLILENYIIKINNIIEQLKMYIIKEDIFIELISKNVKENFQILKDGLIEFNNFAEILKKKLNEIEKNFSYQFDDIGNLVVLINNNLEVLNKKVDERENQIQIQIEHMSTLIKGAIFLEIQNNTYIKKYLEELKEIQKKVIISKKNNDEISQKILKLKKDKFNTYDFAKYISEILKTLEINLKIDVDDNDYILRHTVDNSIIKLSDISEGEKNLLMLIYFYYELFDDNEQKNLKNEISLIVLDDPITSMDNVNRMFILTLIDKMLNIKNLQIFILTHIWEDFCQITYNKKNDKDNQQYGFFEIKKENNQSKLVTTNKKISPYEHDFKEVYELSKKNDASELGECEIYHYPNVIRRVLEKFLEFKVKNNSPTRTNYNNIKDVLCKDGIKPNDENRIGMLLNVCNVLSHNSVRNPDEILKSAKFLMLKIEKVDKLHFDSMLIIIKLILKRTIYSNFF